MQMQQRFLHSEELLPKGDKFMLPSNLVGHTEDSRAHLHTDNSMYSVLSAAPIAQHMCVAQSDTQETSHHLLPFRAAETSPVT